MKMALNVFIALVIALSALVLRSFFIEAWECLWDDERQSEHTAAWFALFLSWFGVFYFMHSLIPWLISEFKKK